MTEAIIYDEAANISEVDLHTLKALMKGTILDHGLVYFPRTLESTNPFWECIDGPSPQ